ncbi:MAG: AraC family transcriptional regulator [Fibrella sp.]|nr:AraC family transcriptional regulator [Armatimonadota bacterium]
MLTISQNLPLRTHNGGLFVSRGTGTHPDRILNSHELIVVRSGTLAIQEQETPFLVGAGDSLLLFPHRRHFGTRPYDDNLSFYWFHFDRADAVASPDSSSLDVPQHVRALGIGTTDELMSLCRRFLDIQASGDEGSGFRGSLLLLEMFSEIAMRANRPVVPLPEDAGVRLADRADALLRIRFAEADLSTQIVANTLHVNPDYLGRVFRRTYGKPLTEALHEYRLRYARTLLLDDSKNITEIARVSGFADAGYFRRVFKRHLAVSPQGFRRLHARAYVNTQ